MYEKMRMTLGNLTANQQKNLRNERVQDLGFGISHLVRLKSRNGSACQQKP